MPDKAPAGREWLAVSIDSTRDSNFIGKLLLNPKWQSIERLICPEDAIIGLL
jgi:hypothetical protein